MTSRRLHTFRRVMAATSYSEGEILDASVAQDISVILLSEAIYSTDSLATKNIHLSDIPSDSVFRWNFPFGVALSGMVVIAFDPNPTGVSFDQQPIGW